MANKPKIQYIPLGTRCSAAFVFQDNLRVRTASYAFDWVDAPIWNFKKFITIDKKDIDTFLTQYFSEIKLNEQRHPDGSYYPHDFYPTDQVFDMLNTVKDKYIRRLERVHEAMDSEDTKVFLTCIDKCNETNIQPYNELCDAIKAKSKGVCIFISVNIKNESVYMFDNKYNLYIERNPDDAQFKLWESHIAIEIARNENLKQYF